MNVFQNGDTKSIVRGDIVISLKAKIGDLRFITRPDSDEMTIEYIRPIPGEELLVEEDDDYKFEITHDAANEVTGRNVRFYDKDNNLVRED